MQKLNQNLEVNMPKKLNVELIIKHLGIYRAFHASAVQFNSVIFRLIVGVLALISGISPTAVAIVTFIEFSLNGLLEVPLGYLADTLGRVPSIILGLMMYMSGLSCVYVALILNNQWSAYLFVAHGILIGLGKPFKSGSVEAFYQNALDLHCKNDSEKKLLLTSLTDSQRYGKFYVLISVTVAFFLSWIFNLLNALPHVFIVGISLYAVCIRILWKDYLIFGDIEKRKNNSSFKKVFKTILQNRKIKLSILYNFYFWMIGVVIAGYLLVSLGREHEGSEQWIFMLSFMYGWSAIGPIVRGYLLPHLIKRMSTKAYLITFCANIVVFSSIFLLLYQKVHFTFQALYLLFYGVIFHVSFSAFQNLSMNHLMEQIKKENYATALSIQNIPGFLGVGLYSLYLILFRSGAPTVHEAFISVLIFSLCYIFVIYYFEGNSKGIAENE
ncbi:MFS transporter [bacterium]|nr:MFS transporter [bacterium]